MAWPKGKKRIVEEKEPPLSHVQNAPEAKTDDGQPDLVLTIRRLKVGSFMGLWELGKVLPDGSIKIISDANTKQIIINLARNEILRCGQ